MSKIFFSVDGKIASVVESDENAYEEILKISTNSFMNWRKTPAPRRGELVRQIGDALENIKVLWDN